MADQTNTPTPQPPAPTPPSTPAPTPAPPPPSAPGRPVGAMTTSDVPEDDTDDDKTA